MKLNLYKVLVLLLLGGLGWTKVHSQTLTVWPGDANNNGIANHVDLLYVALGFGESGPPRNTVTTVWAPQTATAWPSAPVLPNLAYTDCDGSGIIDTADITAIQLNYGLIWGGALSQDSSVLVPFGAPLLSVVMTPDSVQVQGSTSLIFDIMLGDSTTPIDSIHGLAFTLHFDTTIVDTVSSFVPGAFFNFDSTAISLYRVDWQRGVIEVALARTTRSNVSGMGMVGSIGIVMDDDIRVSAEYSLPFNFDHAVAFTLSGEPVFLSPQGDSARIFTNSIPEGLELQVTVFPVPAQSRVQVHTPTLHDATVLVRDIQGRTVHLAELPYMHEYQISVLDWPSGIYLLEIQSQEGVCRAKLVVESSPK